MTLLTLTNRQGAPCIEAKTDALFLLDYTTRRHGTKTAKIMLPRNPEIGGSCVKDGDSAVLSMLWAGFNFSLVYTKNPEGNSYYLNKALLNYNQSYPMFEDGTYSGMVHLHTKKDKNFYFTPLGMTHVCISDEDPLILYNSDDWRMGELTLYNTKIQPFVKRAKGGFGHEQRCLPKSVRVMRENVVPYFVSLGFVILVVLVVAAYGIFRQFFVKKTDYHFYEENMGNETATHEGHEMTKVDCQGQTTLVHQQSRDRADPSAIAPAPETAQPQASNPFKQAGNNPFNN